MSEKENKEKGEFEMILIKLPGLRTKEREAELIERKITKTFEIVNKIGAIGATIILLYVFLLIIIIPCFYYLFFFRMISYSQYYALSHGFIFGLLGIGLVTAGGFNIILSCISYYVYSDLEKIKGMAIFGGIFMRKQGIIALFCVVIGLSFLITTILYLIYIL